MKGKKSYGFTNSTKGSTKGISSGVQTGLAEAKGCDVKSSPFPVGSKTQRPGAESIGKA